MSQLEWEAVARIIAYSIKRDYFPTRLSSSFIKTCFLGDIITKDELKDSFLNYVSSEEKTLIQQNLRDFNDSPELLETLSAFKCYSKPTKENFESIIHQLAHQELVQKPKYISSCFFAVFKVIRFPLKFSPVRLGEFYEKKIPSGMKVSALFNAHPIDPEEAQSLDHLKRFVKNLQLSDLKKLLQVMIGCDLIVVDKIDITYTSLTGLARRPIFHTCGPLLELPKTYGAYNELSEEFLSILNNPKGAFSFDMK